MIDVYQLVTDRIIEALNNNIIPWHKPWIGINEGAFNRVSGRSYSLMNQMLLKHSGEYATFEQWKSLGGTVRKGEKSEFVVFWKIVESIEKNDSGEDVKKTRPILRYYRVFHISQVDGVEPLDQKQKLLETEPIVEAERVFNDYIETQKISLIQELSNQAYYSPSNDSIHLPTLAQFKDAVEFYSTAFHEVVHSTGTQARLNRGLSSITAFGDNQYSKEELVAEIGSAFILRSIGIDSESSFNNSASYIYDWLQELKNDKKLIVHAASSAEKAASYILTCVCC